MREQIASDDPESQAIEQRIQWFILWLGVAMTIGSGVGWGIRAAEGVAAGTAICWLNFRWLRQGAAALVQVGSSQTGKERASAPRTVHAKFFGRIVLLLLVVYAILAWLRLPVIAFLCGLAAVVPAIILELAYEVAHGHYRWKPQ